ncbi:peptidoglycan DD-metalloendopeptidase family protein [Spirochaeta isovalerica]|uniref:Murein DD-endopeptidase MepM/ murein hydrolase activator NlpD n=1 Tax=Spirochaeta isovalerica TaxID=150 RepID=A0A841RDE2_9SPIO|nr:peptidoglycan DD-metalloendopeptidase family protein [Spirochaeta isovalerica]MBB6481983.1 murein DD-endopeptidase MepM/ murein hydrolase activator NlpD [Spirochaeta isovalerica]
MRKVLSVLLFLAASSLFAYQWPIAGGFLTASFGENSSDSFLKGIRISGPGSIVSPFLKGELIYYGNEEDQQAPVLGNVKVLHHENGFRSIYGHLKPFFGEQKVFLEERDQLGLVGDSGRTDEKNLFFMVYDSEMNQYVNPQIILPPSGDSAPPRIETVTLKSDNSLILLSKSNRLNAGRVQVYVDVLDSDGNSSRNIDTVPYSITMFYLGNEINQIKFDTLKEENGKLVLRGGNPVSFNDLYSDGSLYLGEIYLSSGVAFLEISASDISGNNSISTFQLNID